MTTNYKIKMTPADSYFFGSEKSREENGSLVADYFVVSNLYPQQTALLGMLRYFLLLKNPTFFKTNKIVNQTGAATIIGPKSFSHDTSIQEFGKIKTLSPLYFNNGKEDFFFAPMDIKFEMEKENFQLFGPDKEGNRKPYNAKDHSHLISQYLISNSGKTVSLSEVVIKKPPQVGNEKATKGESHREKENKFYKMTLCRLESGWSFCFDAEIDEGSGMHDGDYIFLPFGGEKSFFKLEAKKQDPAKQNLKSHFKRVYPYILCQSDCFVDVNAVDQADFAINDFVSFRNLKSKVHETSKYSALSTSDPEKINRSNRYNLLQRGSVLYFNDEQSRKIVEDLIKENQQNSRNIGFNQILTN